MYFNKKQLSRPTILLGCDLILFHTVQQKRYENKFYWDVTKLLKHYPTKKLLGKILLGCDLKLLNTTQVTQLRNYVQDQNFTYLDVYLLAVINN